MSDAPPRTPPSSPGAAHEERVCAAFCEVCALAPHARRGAIEELRASDAAIAAEVESLLGYHDDDDAILDRSPMVEFDARTERGEAPPAPPALGTVIGGWTLQAPIAADGTFVAFRAKREADGRAGALKIVRPELLTQAMADRFERAGELVWPRDEAIAEHFGTGIEQRASASRAGGSVAYAAAELVEGEALNRFALSHLTALDQRLALAIRVCHAIGAGHAQGVCHTALDPSCVRVLEDGRIKVLDFGLSRLIETPTDAATAGGASAGSGILTLGRSRVRSLSAYAAREQLSLSSALPDARMDVFALAVIAAEMLTGRAPSIGEPDLSALPDALRRILLRALNPAPEHRFANASLFADALAACDLPGKARSRGWWARLSRR